MNDGPFLESFRQEPPSTTGEKALSDGHPPEPSTPLRSPLWRPLLFLLQLIEKLGEGLIQAIEEFGRIMLFSWEVLAGSFQRPFRLRLLIQQLYFVGVGSLFIVLLTGVFTGGVFSLQSHFGFARFGAEGLVGSTVALSLTRELSPVLCALMVTGRVGSAMATELGTMRVTEQIDALETMAVNPVQYLVVPRVLAGLIMLPVLTMMFNLVGLLGSYIVGVTILDIDAGVFWSKLLWYLDPEDIYNGLIKSLVFGVVLTLLGCYKGSHAGGGARGVGVAATQTVVLSSVSILVLDYFLTFLLFEN